MPFLGSALGLTVLYSLGRGNFVAFDWNDLPLGREFDCKFLKKVKSQPHALPPPPAGITLIGAYISRKNSRLFTDPLFSLQCPLSASDKKLKPWGNH